MQTLPRLLSSVRIHPLTGAPVNHIQKVAIITGASHGIGAALVPAYRKLGYAVVAAARCCPQ
jgi:3-oxoacyl-ACP reductase-like protein